MMTLGSSHKAPHTTVMVLFIYSILGNDVEKTNQAIMVVATQDGCD
jgi:hypothetical protein